MQVNCEICGLNVYECESKDRNLIKPFKEYARSEIDHPYNRVSRCVSYITGSYDPSTDTYYRCYLKMRERHDLMISLPLCVFNGDLYSLLHLTNMVILDNVFKLPLQNKYKNELWILLEIKKINQLHK